MARQEMLGFIRSLFRGRPDLSTLTHSIVRRRFLAHTGRACLDAPDKRELKRLVEEELLKMQVEEASVSAEEEEEEEERDLVKKVKRPRPPCRDPARKKPRFDSATEPSSGASSPDANDPLAKNRVTTETGATEERPRRVSKKRVESSDEEQHEDVTVKTAPRGDVKESSEEEEEEEEEKSTEGKKDENDESSEGKEDEKGGTESTGRTRKPPGTSKKRALGKASARRKPAREVSEDSEEEEERSQRTGKKMGRKTRAKSHQESEGEEKQVEEEEDWKSRPQSNGRKRTARHPGSEDGTVQDASGSEADSSGEEPSTQKGKDRLPREEGDRQSRSSAEDGEGDGDESSKAQPAKGTGRPAKAGKLGSGESDSEREVSGSEAEGSPKGERKNRTSNKDSKKGRTRNSSSSSSDGSPEPKGRKAGSGRSGEDHPAVMRLKRYIRACGAHRNYKKLLGSCHSRKECLSVLRAELEALGMKGNPSLEKCRALRERREEEAEVASLDVSNIINCSGRPRRRTAWNPSAAAPPGELYRRTLDSEDEQPRPPPPDWSHMRGIISSDGDSN